VPEGDLIRYEVERGRARIILNRPEKLNAVAQSMGRDIHDRLWEADNDTSVHSVIIKGAGRSFCSGADLSGYRMEDDQPDARRRAFTSTIDDDIWQIERGQRANIAPFDIHKPVIAQVHGHCLALGTVIALFCDFVICADDASFGFPPARDLGALPSNMWLYLVGPQWAKRLTMTGDTITGLAAEIDGRAHLAPGTAEYTRRVRDLGWREAIRQRDAAFGDGRARVNGPEHRDEQGFLIED